VSILPILKAIEVLVALFTAKNQTIALSNPSTGALQEQ